MSHPEFGVIPHQRLETPAEKLEEWAEGLQPYHHQSEPAPSIVPLSPSQAHAHLRKGLQVVHKHIDHSNAHLIPALGMGLHRNSEPVTEIIDHVVDAAHPLHPYLIPLKWFWNVRNILWHTMNPCFLVKFRATIYP